MQIAAPLRYRARRLVRSPLLRGALETAGVMLAFTAFGVGVAAALRAGVPAPYPPIAMAAPPPPGDAQHPTGPSRIWLVDGYNVLHAGVLQGRDRAGWWKAATQARLVELAAAFDDPAAEIWVVFDAARPEAAAERCAEPAGGRVRLVFAPSADDWIVKRVRGDEAPGRLAVVTADRQVQGRARHRGAQVVSPLAFLRRCRGAAAPEATAQAAGGDPDA